MYGSSADDGHRVPSSRSRLLIVLLGVTLHRSRGVVTPLLALVTTSGARGDH